MGQTAAAKDGLARSRMCLTADMHSGGCTSDGLSMLRPTAMCPTTLPVHGRWCELSRPFRPLEESRRVPPESANGSRRSTDVLFHPTTCESAIILPIRRLVRQVVHRRQRGRGVGLHQAHRQQRCAMGAIVHQSPRHYRATGGLGPLDRLRAWINRNPGARDGPSPNTLVPYSAQRHEHESSG